MATVKRAYIAKSVVELRQIAVASSGDSRVIEKLKQELEHRKTAAAKKLLRELEAGGSISLETQSRPQVEPEASISIHKDCETLEASYELLRATFSEQGELLARWGLTESMPHDLLKEVASMWSEKLMSGHGNTIRTPDQLNKDFKQLGISIPNPTKKK